MKSPKHFSFTGVFRLSLSCLVAMIFVSTAFSQIGTSQNESLSSGAYIIAMDNAKQGDCDAVEDFNLRTYGLAVRLLHNNIPLKWVIANKGSKEATDITVNATRITAPGCQNGGVNTQFSGGPLVITQEYAALALPIITAFNNEIAGDTNDVRVYQATAGFTAPVRYTLNHKPRIAVGPDGGNFGTTIHADLFDDAKLRDASNQPYYAAVSNQSLLPTSCYTIATQAHAASNAVNFIQQYRQFAESGGNLELQCFSVEVFENNASFGRFLTTTGWTIFGTNDGNAVDTTLSYPNPSMPFNQFIGALANQDGAVTEFSRSAPERASTAIAVTNTGTQNSLKRVAAVNRIGDAESGGNVFELGGHDYYRQNVSNTEIGRLNGQRMILNTILVPASRPESCNLTIPSIKAFKTVRMFNDVNGNTLPNVGDTVEWTINYINDSNVSAPNFQVSDLLDSKLQYVGPLVVTVANGPAPIPAPATTASKRCLHRYGGKSEHAGCGSDPGGTRKDHYQGSYQDPCNRRDP